MRRKLIDKKTASARQLRSKFPPIKARVQKSAATKPAKPDIITRLRQTWGERVFSLAEVESMRAAELEGEQG